MPKPTPTPAATPAATPAPEPTPAPAPEPTPDPITFPDAGMIFAAARRMLLPAKDRRGTGEERKAWDREARSILAYAFVAVDAKQPAQWVGFNVAMDNGSTQPLGRLVRILAVGDAKGLGVPVSCRID